MLIVKSDIQDKPIKLTDSSEELIKNVVEFKPTSYDSYNVASFNLYALLSTLTDFNATIVSEDSDSWKLIYRSTLSGDLEKYDTISYSDVVLRDGSTYTSLPFGVSVNPKKSDGEPLLDEEYNESTIAILYIDYVISGQSYSHEISLYSNVIDFDYHLKEQLEVFNLDIDNDMYESFKDTPIKQPYKDAKVLNEKRRELILRQFDIKGFIGSYKSLINVLDFLGYGELLSIREIWVNEDKVATTEITSQVLDFIDKRLSGFKKTNNLQLVYQLNQADGTFDSNGVPFYVNVLVDTEVVLYKMFLIRDILEERFLPYNVKITDIIGEYTQPAINSVGVFHSPTSNFEIQSSGFKDNNYIKVEDKDLIISNRHVLTKNFYTEDVCQSLRFEPLEAATVSDSSYVDFEWDEPFTISMWVKFDEITPNNILMTKLDRDLSTSYSARGWYIGIINPTGLRDVLNFRVFEANTAIKDMGFDATNLSINTWHHITITYNGSQDILGVFLYLDGQSLPRHIGNNATFPTGTISNVGNFAVGEAYNTLTDPVSGLFKPTTFATTRIWNTNLSSSDVLSLYNSSIPKQGNLVLDLDYSNTSHNGNIFTIDNLASPSNGLTSNNMPVERLLEDCPEDLITQSTLVDGGVFSDYLPTNDYYNKSILDIEYDSQFTFESKSILHSPTEYSVASDSSYLDFSWYAPFSVSCWFKVDDVTPFNIFMSKAERDFLNPDSPVGWFIGLTNIASTDVVGLRFFFGASEIKDIGFDISNITINKWHHLTFTYDGSQNIAGCDFYLDGQLMNSFSDYDDAITIDITNNGNFVIGDAFESYTSPSSGLGKNTILATTRLWDVELTATDAQSLYKNIIPKESNLVANFDLQNAYHNGSTFTIDNLASPSNRLVSNAMPSSRLVDDIPEVLLIEDLDSQFSYIDLDGSGEYIANDIYPSTEPTNSIFSFDKTDPFSISIWFKMDTIGSFDTIVCKSNFSIINGYYIAIVSNKPRFVIQSGTGSTSSGALTVNHQTSIVTNKWHNIIATYDGSGLASGLKIYLDSVENSSSGGGTLGVDSISNTTTPLKFFIGRGTSPTEDGKFNSSRVWNVELSASEVIDEYNGGFPKTIAVNTSNLLLELDSRDSAFSTEYELLNKTGLTPNFIAYNTESEDLLLAPTLGNYDKSKYIIGVNTSNQLVIYYTIDGTEELLSSDWYYQENLAFDYSSGLVYSIAENNQGDIELIGLDTTRNVVTKETIGETSTPTNLTYYDSKLYYIIGDDLKYFDLASQSISTIGTIGWANTSITELDLVIDSLTEDIYILGGDKGWITNLSSISSVTEFDTDIENITGVTLTYNTSSTTLENIVISATTSQYTSSIYVTPISELQNNDISNDAMYENIPVVVKDLSHFALPNYGEPLTPIELESTDRIYISNTNSSFSLLESGSETLVNATSPFGNNLVFNDNLAYTIDSDSLLSVYEISTQTLVSTHQFDNSEVANGGYSSLAYWGGYIFFITTFSELKVIYINDYSVATLSGTLGGSIDQDSKIWIDKSTGNVYIIDNNDDLHKGVIDLVNLEYEFEALTTTMPTTPSALSGYYIDGEVYLLFADLSTYEIYEYKVSDTTSSVIFTSALEVSSINHDLIVTKRPLIAFDYEPSKTIKVGNINQILSLNNSLLFDGGEFLNLTNDSIFDIDSTDTVSFSVWLKQTSSGTLQHVISKYYSVSPEAYGYVLYLGTSRNVSFTMQNQSSLSSINSFTVTTVNSIALNTWVNVTVTYDGSLSASGCRIYINGVNQSLTVGLDTLSGSILNTEPLQIASGTTGGSPFKFIGNIYSVKGWNIELSSADVLSEYGFNSTNESSLFLFPQIAFAEYDSEFSVTDTANSITYTSSNMESSDLVSDAPSGANLYLTTSQLPNPFLDENSDFILIDEEVKPSFDDNSNGLHPYKDYQLLNNFRSIDVGLIKLIIGFEPEEYKSFKIEIFNTSDINTDNPSPIFITSILDVLNLEPEMYIGCQIVGDFTVRFTLIDKHGGNTILQDSVSVSSSAPDFSLCLIDRDSINPYTKEYQYDIERIYETDINNYQSFHRGDIQQATDSIYPTEVIYEEAQDSTLGFHSNSIAVDPLSSINNISGDTPIVGSNPFENYTALWSTFAYSSGYPMFSWIDINHDINDYPLIDAQTYITETVKDLMYKSPDAYMKETHIGEFLTTSMSEIKGSRIDDYGYSYPRWYIDILGEEADGDKEFTLSFGDLTASFTQTYTSASQTPIEFVREAVTTLNESSNELLSMFTFALEYVSLNDISSDLMIRATFRFKGYLSEWFTWTTSLNVIDYDYQSYGSLAGFSRVFLDNTLLSDTLTIQRVHEDISGQVITQNLEELYSDTLTYTTNTDLRSQIEAIFETLDVDINILELDTDEMLFSTNYNIKISHGTFGTLSLKSIGLEGSVLNVYRSGEFVQKGQPFYAYINTYSREHDAFVQWDLVDSHNQEIVVTQFSLVFRYQLFISGTFDLRLSIVDRNGIQTITKQGFITIK